MYFLWELLHGKGRSIFKKVIGGSPSCLNLGWALIFSMIDTFGLLIYPSLDMVAVDGKKQENLLKQGD